MRKYKIKITDLAEQDLEKIGDYITYIKKNPSAAINTVKGIRKAISKLRYAPKLELDEDEELAALGIRKIYYKNYKAYYIIDEKNQAVIIVRILHMLVDSGTWLRKTFKL